MNKIFVKLRKILVKLSNVFEIFLRSHEKRRFETVFHLAAALLNLLYFIGSCFCVNFLEWINKI